ncbi:hypothetical protein BKA70DRAFT_467947 [Coprinopsis sp. MPI-PUGE-AT-0042]|nr:hypothetical protein BKA70DRAFT_467947 [Coprinopsis sp. MPI-PUGE-AT-0042]
MRRRKTYFSLALIAPKLLPKIIRPSIPILVNNMVHTPIAVLLAALVAAPAFAAPIASALEARYSQDIEARVPHLHLSLRETTRDFNPFDIDVRTDDGKDKGKGKEKEDKAKQEKERIRLKSFDHKLIDSSATEIRQPKAKSQKRRRSIVIPHL